MSDAKEIIWKDEIKKRAEQATKRISDKLSARLGGYRDLDPGARRDVEQELVETTIHTMLMLGSCLIAGANESIESTLAKYGGDQKGLTITLKGGATPEQLAVIAANSGRSVMLSFVNKLAFEQARDELIKAVHRSQMDWIGEKTEDAEERGETRAEYLLRAAYQMLKSASPGSIGHLEANYDGATCGAQELIADIEAEFTEEFLEIEDGPDGSVPNDELAAEAARLKASSEPDPQDDGEVLAVNIATGERTIEPARASA